MFGARKEFNNKSVDNNMAMDIAPKRISFIQDFDMEFREQLRGYVNDLGRKNDPPNICRNGASNKERYAYLEAALHWLKDELQQMRSQDRSLAKQLIGLRAKIQNIMQEDEYTVDVITVRVNTESEDTKL